MWPEDVQCVVSLTFDLDAESVWVAVDPTNADKPGILSQGRYGPRVAIPLILALLERQNIQATFFIPGKVAEDHPETVKRIAAAGHELGVHGYTHIAPTKLTPEEEEESLIRARSILETFGVQVAGYRSPAWEFSPHTLGFLEKHTFSYSSNLMDDIRPYRHPDTDLVELPVHWLLDDAPHFWFDNNNWTKKIATPSEVNEIWEAEFDGIYELGGSFILTLHPQIIGRPHRLKMLERFIGFMQSYNGVRFATCAEVATLAKKSLV